MTQGKSATEEPCYKQRLRIVEFFVWAFEELTRAEEKEGAPVLTGADGGPILQVAKRDGELPSAGEDG